MDFSEALDVHRVRVTPPARVGIVLDVVLGSDEPLESAVERDRREPDELSAAIAAHDESPGHRRDD